MPTHIADSRRFQVPAVVIDGVVNGEAVTAIKMDIEGAEPAALRGAAGIIRRHKLRLAASLYHQPGDILEIPAYIVELREDHTFHIRHYTYWPYTETALYAQ